MMFGMVIMIFVIFSSSSRLLRLQSRKRLGMLCDLALGCLGFLLFSLCHVCADLL